MSDARPEGWAERLHAGGDFAQALAELDGYTHFFSETLRAAVRSLQLRIRTADRHFRAASELIREAPRTLDNAGHALIHCVLLREHALLKGDSSPFQGLRTPGLDQDEWMRIFPHEHERLRQRLLAGLREHTAMDAQEGLANGDAVGALRTYEGLLSNCEGTAENQSLWNIGIAICLYNLADLSNALQHLVIAEDHLRQSTANLVKAKIAGRLSAVYRFLGIERKAADWLEYLEEIPCHPRARDLMAQRGEIMFHRSMDASWLHLV